LKAAEVQLEELASIFFVPVELLLAWRWKNLHFLGDAQFLDMASGAIGFSIQYRDARSTCTFGILFRHMCSDSVSCQTRFSLN